MASMDYENENGTRYEGNSPIPDGSSLASSARPMLTLRAEEAPRYERDNRSASPRPQRRDPSPRRERRRSASPGGRNGGGDDIDRSAHLSITKRAIANALQCQ